MDRNTLFDSEHGVEFSGTDKVNNLPGQAIWTQVREKLATVLNATDYDRWIEDLRLIAEVDGEMVIAARDPLAYDRVVAEHKRLIQRTWRELDPARRGIRLECWRNARTEIRDLVSDPWAETAVVSQPEPAIADSGDGEKPTGAFNASGAPEMTFETLVVGQSNEIAVQLAQRVAAGQTVGTSTTLIYGRQGTGKTHLLMALKNRVEARDSDRVVVYLTAEEFMSAYHDGVKARDTSGLKRRLRSATLLLIDDLHRIAGKPGTETELYQNIREVTGNGGQVVLAGDEAPGDVTGFGPRMRAELKGSIAVEVGLPDADMRREILVRLAAHIEAGHPDFVLTDEMITRINAGIRGPGRELTGAIWSLYTEAGFGDRAPTLDMLDRVIRRHQGEIKVPTIELVKRATMKVFNISKSDLESPCKARAVVYPRQVAMYLCREKTGKSLPQIGHSFGKRDHTTILYAHRKVTKNIATDPELAGDIARVTEAIFELQAAGAN
ncbi:chromosomal replication initiator protein DnaA [Hyphomonas sp.]|uniref:chromosomal replication initiator protein DnaA n=1 Tax=Hyphomonas sp. TaxID=87 RepID=UPI0032EE813F